MSGQINDVAVICEERYCAIRGRAEICNDINTVTGSVNKAVGPGTTGQCIIAGAANNRIVTAAAIEGVITAAT